MPETLTAPANRVNQVPITDDVLNVQDFNDRIVGAYNDGSAELGLPADDTTLRSFIPAGTGIGLTLIEEMILEKFFFPLRVVLHAQILGEHRRHHRHPITSE